MHCEFVCRVYVAVTIVATVKKNLVLSGKSKTIHMHVLQKLKFIENYMQLEWINKV